MTFAQALSLAAGFLAVAAAACWPKLPGRLSYLLAGAGICWLVYSGITALQAILGTKLPHEDAVGIVVVATLLAAGIFWHIHRANGAPEAALAARPLVAEVNAAKTSPREPTLLTLFMTDSAADGSAGNLSVQANGYVNLTMADDSKLRVFYTMLDDPAKKARFINCYVPESAHTYDACEYIATGYRQIVDQGADPASAASASPAFAGRVFIYHETELTRRELGKLGELYAANKLKPEFRGARYAETQRQGARRSKSPSAGEFVIKDGLIMRAPTRAA